VINDVAVSGLTGGYTYVIVGGTNGTDAELYTMKLAMAQNWMPQYGKYSGTTYTHNAGNVTPSQDYIKTIELSPNFQIDKIVSVISADDSATDVFFQCFRYETGAETWNQEIAYFGTSWGTGLDIGDLTASSTLAAADIEFLPSYDGTDDGERIAFVSFADSATTAAGDVQRLTDSYAKQITTWAAAAIGPVYSLAYHEEGKLLIGDYDENQVYITLSPMDTNPRCERVNSYKQPGGTNKTFVDWNGDTAVALTQGDESSFSVSEDDAYSFNDISLINTTMSYVTDFAVSSDASKSYAASYDSTNDVSIFAKVGSGYQRVLSMKGVASGIEDIAIRMAPDDSDVVYINSRSEQEMWMSRDGGNNKWKSVPCYKLTGVQDFTVESTDVVYAISTTGMSKSINGGASWSEPVSFEGKGGYMVIVAPNNDILVGCSEYILRSQDGGSTFEASSDLGSGNVVFACDSNYADNGIVYYNSGGSSTSISRRSLDGGPPKTIGIELPGSGSLPSAGEIKDLAMIGDALYVLTTDGSDSRLYRALNPGGAADKVTALWGYVETAYELGLAAYSPQPIKPCPDYEERGVGAMPKLYFVEDPNGVVAFEDALATFSVTTNAPADGETVPVNSLTGRAYDMTFTWERFDSDYITECDIQVATDPDFNALIVDAVYTGISKDTFAAIIGPNSSTAELQREFMPNTTYYYRIRVSYVDSASGSGGAGPLLSNWSAVRSFTVSNEVPFSIADPAVGATGVSLTPTLSWNDYPGALHYVVELADGSIPEGITFTILDMSNTSDYPFLHIDEPLKYSNTYYWRVKAVLSESYTVGSGRSATTVPGESSEWLTGSFTTMAVPEEAQPPVIIEEATEQPDIIVNPIVEVPETTEVIPSYLLWIIVAIGAILVIALIVLIVRTRRVV
jgi:hypothetical protein